MFYNKYGMFLWINFIIIVIDDVAFWYYQVKYACVYIKQKVSSSILNVYTVWFRFNSWWLFHLKYLILVELKTRNNKTGWRQWDWLLIISWSLNTYDDQFFIDVVSEYVAINGIITIWGIIVYTQSQVDEDKNLQKKKIRKYLARDNNWRELKKNRENKSNICVFFSM